MQTDILAKASQLTSIADIVKHAEAFEAALRDQSKLHNASEASALRSSTYKMKQRGSFQQQRLVCAGCGSNTHGIPGLPPRHSHCPAWGKFCDECKKPNHQTSVCHRDSFASGLIAHVHYNPEIDSFTSPDAIQELEAQVTPVIRDVKGGTIKIFPDSGANICMAGPHQMLSIGAPVSKLTPCTKRVKTVGGASLICKGWIPIHFSIEGHTTTQPVYFCDKVERLYSSKQACVDIHIYPGVTRTLCSILLTHQLLTQLLLLQLIVISRKCPPDRHRYHTPQLRRMCLS